MRRLVVVAGITLVAVMGIISFFKKNDRQLGGSGQYPWQGRTAIYDHIRSHLDETGKKLTKAGDSLPDAEVRFDRAGMTWVSGGMDGTMGRHWGAGGDKEAAKKVSSLIIRISRRNALRDRVGLYEILTEDVVLDYIGPALEQVVNAGVHPRPYLHDFARFLATKSPDRGPVKFGIALLGLIADETDKDIVTLLGRHEEFTL